MRTYMNSKALKASIPPQLLQLAHEVGKFTEAKRPRMSRPLRQALHAYAIAKISVVKPTKAELRYIEEGREEFERGEFVTLDEWEDELHKIYNNKSKKSRKKVSE